MTDENPSSIDDAVDTCITLAKTHEKQARSVLFLAYLSFLASTFGVLFAVQPSLLGSMPEAAAYLVFGTFITVFGVLMATYRYHLAEISRFHQAQLGFMRIRVAARNSKPGFQTEVRKALTETAFSFPDTTARPFLSRSKKIESPLPGHPASDLTTQVLNKIVEQLEISLKSKNA